MMTSWTATFGSDQDSDDDSESEDEDDVRRSSDWNSDDVSDQDSDDDRRSDDTDDVRSEAHTFDWRTAGLGYPAPAGPLSIADDLSDFGIGYESDSEKMRGAESG